MAQLLEAIQHLAPAERRELQRQLRAWQEDTGRPVGDDSELRRAAKARLPAAEERRLRRLIRKSEQGTLTPKERTEYRALAQRAEQLNVERAEALAELVRRRGQPAHLVRKDLSAEGGVDDA
jgi:hypothetical protein